MEFCPGNDDETVYWGGNGFERFSALDHGAAGLLSLLIVDFFKLFYVYPSIFSFMCENYSF